MALRQIGNKMTYNFICFWMLLILRVRWVTFWSTLLSISIRCPYLRWSKMLYQISSILIRYICDIPCQSPKNNYITSGHYSPQISPLQSLAHVLVDHWRTANAVPMRHSIYSAGYTMHHRTTCPGIMITNHEYDPVGLNSGQVSHCPFPSCQVVKD